MSLCKSAFQHFDNIPEIINLRGGKIYFVFMISKVTSRRDYGFRAFGLIEKQNIMVGSTRWPGSRRERWREWCPNIVFKATSLHEGPPPQISPPPGSSKYWQSCVCTRVSGEHLRSQPKHRHFLLQTSVFVFLWVLLCLLCFNVQCSHFLSSQGHYVISSLTSWSRRNMLFHFCLCVYLPGLFLMLLQVSYHRVWTRCWIWSRHPETC